MIAVLRRRSFAALWLGGLISTVGDWALYAALPFYVFERTGSTLATAAMIVAELGPGVVLSSLAGALVDRWNRRRILIADYVVQALAVAGLLGLAAGAGLWLVYAVAVVQASTATLGRPARGSLLPLLVPDEALVPANALNALSDRLARIIGVPLGGLLLAGVGLPAVILVDCASFLVAAGLVGTIRGVRPPAPAPTPAPTPGPEPAPEPAPAPRTPSLRRELAEGFAVIRRDRTIATVFVVLGLMTFGGTMLDPLGVAWVSDVLDAGPGVYALLLTIHAVVGTVGSLLVARYAVRRPPHTLIGWTSVVAGVSCAVQYTFASLPLAVGLTGLRGLTSVTANVGVDTLIQRTVPDPYRGRVLGALSASGSLLSLLGAITAGAVGQAIGVVPALDLAAALIALSGIVALRSFVDSPRLTTATARP